MSARHYERETLRKEGPSGCKFTFFLEFMFNHYLVAPPKYLIPCKFMGFHRHERRNWSISRLRAEITISKDKNFGSEKKLVDVPAVPKVGIPTLESDYHCY